MCSSFSSVVISSVETFLYGEPYEREGVDEMDAEMTLQDMEITYEKVKSLAGWMFDSSVVLTITSYYVAADYRFSSEGLNKSMNMLKHKAGWLSPLRGHSLPLMGAFIDQSAHDVEKEIDALFVKQRYLRKLGFRNTIHSYLAASLLTTQNKQYKEEAQRASALFDEIKNRKIFSTGDYNYAYAVLLAKKGHELEAHVEAIKFYYDALVKAGFQASYQLQWMAQILSCIAIQHDEKLIYRAQEVVRYFNREVTVEPIHYPVISFLSIFKVRLSQLDNILELTKLLQKSTTFSYTKSSAFSLAIGTQTYHITENNLNFMVPLSASGEEILQAQQAVTIAAIITYVHKKEST